MRVGLAGSALAALTLHCGGDPPASTPTPAPTTPTDPARPGKVEPAPHSPLALGRTVFEALQHDDWEGYTNVLATRADMMAVFEDADRGEGRERRRRRRMVWRRVNRLRDGGAERGWKETRRSAKQAGVAWGSARLVDVRHAPPSPDSLPGDATAAQLRLVIEHGGTERAVELGPCVRSPRGWIVLYPMRWLDEGSGEPFGESLLSPKPEPEPETTPTPKPAPAP
ncbi:MAG: hypothetical protein KDK70_13145 [Myxococcales bacterium]|nr:hypothetical protein [Myxococcales bacterium]